MKDPWILTEQEKQNIHVFQAEPDMYNTGPRAAFTWCYEVTINGVHLNGNYRHPTRRAAWQAAKSFYKIRIKLIHATTILPNRRQ